MTAPDSLATVLFDWNGTVLDDMERARRASSLVRKRWAGLPELTLDEFRDAWCLPLSDHVMRLGVSADRSEAAGRAWSTHLSALDAPLSPGVPATLGALRSAGIAIAVVSAASDDAVRRDLRSHDLEQCFDSIHCGVADKQTVIRRYVESAGTGAVWYVGDTKMDMLQARECWRYGHRLHPRLRHRRRTARRGSTPPDRPTERPHNPHCWHQSGPSVMPRRAG